MVTESLLANRTFGKLLGSPTLKWLRKYQSWPPWPELKNGSEMSSK